MVVAIGSGLQSFAETATALSEGLNDRTEIFTSHEVAYCDAKRYPAVHYAARFAAKSALLRALGLPDGRWLEIEGEK